MIIDANEERVRSHLLASAEVKRHVAATCAEAVAAAATLVADALRSGGKLMLCGNGGSASDAQHIAAEFTNGLDPRRGDPPRAAMALNSDTTFLTAHSNDFGFATIFRRQIEAIGRPGDVLLAITTSGNSRNVIEAVEACRTRSIRTIGLTGGTGGQLRALVDLPIVVPSDDTQYIQESHIAIGHIVADLVLRVLDEHGSLSNGTHVEAYTR
jgi:phosphoheptose isomerase